MAQLDALPSRPPPLGWIALVDVRITVVRPGRDRPFDVNITRAIIDIPAVRSEVRDRVGILTVTTFNRNTTEATQRAMQRNGKTYEPVIFPGAGHGFLRAQTGQDGANMEATEAAWPRTVEWFRTHLGS